MNPLLVFCLIAMVGPPQTLPSRSSEWTAEVGRGTRDVDFDGSVGVSSIAKTEIKISQTSFALRGAYAIGDYFSPYLLLGLSHLDAGNIGLGAGGVSAGNLDMKGEYGFLWGVGANYVFPPLAAMPDIRLGASAEYRRYTSDIPGGSIEVDDIRAALKGSRRFDKVTPYGGLVFSRLAADYLGVTSAGQRASGNMESADQFGLLIGAGYEFTEKISGQIEAELISSFTIGASLTYRMGGPSIRAAEPPSLPPPARADEPRRVEAPAPAPPARQVKPPTRPEQPAIETASERAEREARERRDLRAAEEQIRLGNEYTALGRYDEAIIHYRRAIAADPWNVRAWYNLATAQYLNRDYSGARESFEKTIALKSDDVDAHLYLGFSHYRLGNLDAAARAWRRVLELDPNNSVALNNLQALGR